LQIREHWIIDLREEVRNFDFEILFRFDIISNAAVFRRELVQQRGIHVVTNSKSKQSHAGLRRFTNIVDDPRNIRFVDCRQTISHKHEHLRSLSIHFAELTKRSEQRLVDVCSTNWFESFDEWLAARATFLVRGN